MARYGSEEFYNVPYMQPAAPYAQYGDQQRTTLNQLENQGSRQRDVIRRIGEDNANTTREVGYNLGNAVGNLPGQYINARGAQQNYRHREEMHPLETEEARARMESGQIALEGEKGKQAFLKGIDPKSGVSRQETAWGQDLENQRLLNQERIANIQDAQTRRQQLATTFQNEQTDRKLTRLQAQMETDISMGRPLDATIAKAQHDGINDNDIAYIQSQAGKAVKSGEFLANTTYTGSPEGQLATQATVDLNEKAYGIAQLDNAIKSYEAAPAGSREASEAKQQVKDALYMLKVDPNTVDGGFFGVTADLGGVKYPSDRMKQALKRAQDDAGTQLRILKSRAGANSSPAMQRTIQNLEMTLAQAAQGNRVNLFGGQVNSGGTMLTNALNGNPVAPQQQGGMMPVGQQLDLSGANQAYGQRKAGMQGPQQYDLGGVNQGYSRFNRNQRGR